MKKFVSIGLKKLKSAAGEMIHGGHDSQDEDDEFDERSMVKVRGPAGAARTTPPTPDSNPPHHERSAAGETDVRSF